MILSRIQRGAVRTHVLIQNKIVQTGRFAAASYIRMKRPVGLSMLAAYTATIPLHAVQGSIALAEGSEPPSKTVSVISSDTLASINLNTINVVHLNQVQPGKSNDELEAEARFAADQLARKQEAARQAQILAQQQKEVENIRVLQAIPAPALVAAPNPAPLPSFTGNVADRIAEVAGHYNASAGTIQLIQRIANCESHFNPDAHNSSGASGVFQFMPGTWHATLEGRAGKSPYDAEANIEAGVRKMLVEGDWSAWQCYFIVRK